MLAVEDGDDILAVFPQGGVDGLHSRLLQGLTDGEDILPGEGVIFLHLAAAPVHGVLPAGDVDHVQIVGGLGYRIGYPLGICLRKVDDGQGGVALGNAPAGDHGDGSVLVKLLGLHSGQDRIGAVGEHQDLRCGDLFKGIQEFLGAGALLAQDRHVGTHVHKKLLNGRVAGHSHHREGALAGRVRTQNVFGHLCMLHRHVLHLQVQKLAVAVAEGKDLFRSLGVDVDAHFVRILQRYHAVAHGHQRLFKAVEPEGLPVAEQLDQKLRAVAEIKDGIRVKSGVIRLRLAFLSGLKGLQGLAVQIFLHTLEEVDDTGTAAVYHAGLLQSRQKLRGVIQRDLGVLDEHADHIVDAVAGLQPGLDRIGGVLDHRQHGALHGGSHCIVGAGHALFQSRDQLGGVGGF